MNRGCPVPNSDHTAVHVPLTLVHTLALRSNVQDNSDSPRSHGAHGALRKRALERERHGSGISKQHRSWFQGSFSVISVPPW